MLPIRFRAILRNALRKVDKAEMLANQKLAYELDAVFGMPEDQLKGRDPEAVAEQISAQFLDENPDYQTDCARTKTSSIHTTRLLTHLLIKIAAKDRVAGLHLSQLAARYVFTHSKNNRGFSTGVEPQSGRNCHSGLFSTLVDLTHNLANLECTVQPSENRWARVYGRTRHVPAKEFAQAAKSLLYVVTRQRASSAIADMVASDWQGLVAKAPCVIRDEAIAAANEHIIRFPLHHRRPSPLSKSLELLTTRYTY